MKRFFYILLCLVFSGCTTNYQLTTFYVHNNTDKTVNFKASIIKYSTMGQGEMTLPFTVSPGDTIVARKAKFRKDVLPNEWFTQFIIFPMDSVILNDPNILTNWIRSTDAKGRPVYVFNVAK